MRERGREGERERRERGREREREGSKIQNDTGRQTVREKYIKWELIEIDCEGCLKTLAMHK